MHWGSGLDGAGDGPSNRRSDKATKGGTLMSIWRGIILVLTFLTFMVASAEGSHDGVVLHDEVHEASNALELQILPVDPVVEEPIRQLRPAVSSVLPGDGTQRCGAMGTFTLGTLLLLPAVLGLTSKASAAYIGREVYERTNV